MVAAWSWTAGYTIEEVGEDVSACYDQECLIVVNHQSTADVPLLMASFETKANVVENMMWLMDRLFKFTNFGIVSYLHGDFFIRSGKNFRDCEIQKLKEHIVKVYSARRRKWLVLFPEGGFLRKRKETSQRFAKANNLPHLDHVSLPRLGAMHAIVNTLNPETHDDASHHNHLDSNCVGSDVDVHCAERVTSNNRLRLSGGASKKLIRLKWLIDITIAYPSKDPLDLPTICSGSVPPQKTTMHYRTFPIEQVPTDMDGLTLWMYDRWVEKEEMLNEFYRTGEFPVTPSTHGQPRLKCPRQIELDNCYLVVAHVLFILSTILHYHMIKWVFCLVWG